MKLNNFAKQITDSIKYYYSMFHIPCSMKKGFTLLEVIIAISILTVGVGGTFILIHQTLRAASLSNSKLIAAYLAQEGTEIVRNFRDNNWLEQRADSGLSWKDGLETGEYEVGYNDSSLSIFSGQGRYLHINSLNGFYGYSGDKQTKFKRKITIANGEGEEAEIKLIVTVEVFWEERGKEHKVEVVKNLYNWQGY